MSQKKIRMVILLATLSLIGIITTQFFWVKNAFNLQEKQFNERVQLALNNVARDILTINHDPSELINPVKQISSNYFIVSINDTVHPYLLETLLKNEFKRRNIDIDFEYVIYDCFTDSVVFGNFVSLSSSDRNQLQEKSKTMKWDRDGHYFGVYFPSKNAYIVSNMGIWVFSSSIIFLIIIFFSYTISVILKQKKLSEIKTDFINNMTHEFKTPISTISLSADVISNPQIINEPDRLKNYAKIIKEENERLRKQVDKVLQLATLEKDQLKLENEPVDIHELLINTKESLSLILKEKNGEIKLDLKAEKHKINADVVHLSNVFFNLIDNAIKYADKNPEIIISTKNEKNSIFISIKDNGIGIDKDYIKNIFEKFYRVPTGNVHNVKGFGLGLNYVQTIVKAYKGKVTVFSEPGKGSEFIIELPVNNH